MLRPSDSRSYHTVALRVRRGRASRRKRVATTRVAMPQSVWYLKIAGKSAENGAKRAAARADGIHNLGVDAACVPAVLPLPNRCRLMPFSAAPATGGATPEARRRRVAAILARGVVRYRRIAELAVASELSPPRKPGLELVSETRLSVNVGLADIRRAPEAEVNDGRDT